MGQRDAGPLTLSGPRDLFESHGDHALVRFDVISMPLHSLISSRKRPTEEEIVSFGIREGAAHLFDQ
jgi:hypothetical protein